MSKEATESASTADNAKKFGNNAGESSMQSYLQYLKSDRKPVPVEEQLPLTTQLSAWRNHRAG